MCDYSLEHYQSRPARAGERYVTHRFRSGSIGLVSDESCETAVCVPYDTRLHLEGIPKHVQEGLGVGPTESVTFVQAVEGYYRDAVEFADGSRLSLQRLGPGVTVTVDRALERTDKMPQWLEGALEA